MKFPYLLMVAMALGTAAWAAPESVPGPESSWTMAAVGDAIITHRAAQFDHAGDPRFQRMVRLIRGADVGFLNLEVSLFRLSEFKGWPEAENGGNYELGPPEAAQDLKRMGFNLFNRANNHTTDYGVEGMRQTDSLLDRLDIVHAGTGENLGLASRPGYLDTTRGRVALIGVATTFTPMSRAGAARPDVMGRPGVNALRVKRKFLAEPAMMEQLKALSCFATPTTGLPDGKVHIFDAAVEPGPQNRVLDTVDASDQERVLHEVRNACKMADFVMVSSHTHEPNNLSEQAPPWLQEFAHKCIDAGATAFIGHGPHQLRGIEVYKGRPIFYSLGNFFFQNQVIDPVPAEEYERFGLPSSALASEMYDVHFKNDTVGFPTRPACYESVIAIPTFTGRQMSGLKLYPLDLAQKAPRSQRGTPRLAEEAVGHRILERMTRLSAAYGTALVEEDGVGVWSPQRAK